MRVLLRMMMRCGLALCSFLAGCSFDSGGKITNDYGIEIPRTPGDPTVEIIDFSYTPASPVTVGEGIVFTAILNKGVDRYYAGPYLTATIGSTANTVPGTDVEVILIGLSDNGGLYDEIAGDLIYSGALEWRADYGVAEGLPVIAKLSWWDDTPDVIFTGSH